MSSNHDVSRERLPVASQQNAPEVPRRPRSTLQGSRSAHVGRNVNNHNSHQRHHPPQPAVREIHKNAWLKRVIPSDKKGTSLMKKYDKLWVVFCVHDDVEAFLEFYSEPKLGVSHRPSAYVSLNSCLHVSPSIVGQENDEYQFAVTLSTEVIRLVAINWEQMNEWVESLQGKLREMNILSPKDNLYSKLPESRGTNGLPSYISTRDPNSPLPPTPNRFNPGADPSPSSLLPNHDTERHHITDGSSRSNTNVNVVLNSAPVSLLNENYGSAGIPTYAQPSSGSDSGLGSGGSIMSISEPRVTIFPISVGSGSSSLQPSHSHENGSDSEITRPRTPSPSVSVVTGNNNSTRLQVGSDENESFLDNLLHALEPSIPLYSQPKPKNSQPNPATIANDPSVPTPKVKNHNDVVCRQLSAPPRPNSTPSENLYEYLFTPEAEMNGSGESSFHRNSNANNNSSPENATEPPVVPRRNLQKRLSNHTHHRSSSLNRLGDQNDARSNSSSKNQEDAQQDSSRIFRTNGLLHNQRVQVHRGQADGFEDTAFIHVHGLQGDPIDALIGLKSGEYRMRREEGVPVQQLGPDHNSDGSGNPAPHGGNLMSHIPLKEQQVLRLRAEIKHPGGVRVVLRKKDCVNSIGFVDYLGAVWIAGWKQQQHPVLYYAFHVGDQVLKVAGVAVQNSVEANRAIKMASNLQVEFIFKRVPHGNVFVLKRSREGEPLGLVAINNTPEIGEVLPDGLAASQGLPPSCRGTDGLSNCTWFLTEVNNRPLSLLARENEVRDRLNAVGKEISILVQPSDLVKHLKKQLKSMKGFKDYLVV